MAKEAVNSQYRDYYQAIKTRLQAFSDVVYYEPLPERAIRELEKHLGQTIKPLYREYLRAFGLTQDIFETFRIDRETMLEVFDSIRDSRAGYLPLSVDLADAETLYLLNNRDQSDQQVYVARVADDGSLGTLRKLKPFQELIEAALTTLPKQARTRCPNSAKINVLEVHIPGPAFAAFSAHFAKEGLTQETEWGPPYYPENLFDVEVARFRLWGQELRIERTADRSQYGFELAEPILTGRAQSLLQKTERLLKRRGLPFEKTECRLIATQSSGRRRPG